jgi:HAD superfamily hydrolase (TIGR01509 family)
MVAGWLHADLLLRSPSSHQVPAREEHHMNKLYEKPVLAFDYDGVLADTEPLHWRSWREIISPFAIELSWEQYCRHCRGVAETRMREVLIALHPDAANMPDLSPYLSARKRKVREWSLESPPISAQTIDLLQSLGAWRAALVTSAERSDIEPVLLRAQVLGCFEVLVFGDSVSKPKPAPDPYLAVSARMKTNAGIAFEDSESGMASARSAGFHVVQIANPDDLPGAVARTLEDCAQRRIALR